MGLISIAVWMLVPIALFGRIYRRRIVLHCFNYIDDFTDSAGREMPASVDKSFVILHPSICFREFFLGCTRREYLNDHGVLSWFKQGNDVVSCQSRHRDLRCESGWLLGQDWKGYEELLPYSRGQLISESMDERRRKCVPAA